jgi:hypothetical protein
MRAIVKVAALVGACASGLGATNALATTTSPLILKADGAVAPAGTPATGVLQFGPCGTLRSSGTLVTNERRTDKAALPNVEEEGGGGCGEGGPNVTGQIDRIKVASAGRLTVVGEVSYATILPEECVYRLTKLKGHFAIPGSTQALVSGVGFRAAGSSEGCAEKLRVRDAEAALYDSFSGEAFEAEL